MGPESHLSQAEDGSQEMESNQENGPDISDPEVQRRLLLEQDPKILEAAALLAARIKAIPPDPDHPDWEPQALLVGGFVRDSLLGKSPKDADIEVYGISSKRLTDFLEQTFPGRVSKVGQQFEVLKVFVEDGIDFDVSLPRRESKTGAGHSDFDIQGDPSMSIMEAARRRDFTMNALAADPLTGKVFDFFGGVDDLKNGILRATDKERFQDDALRVYRAIQFMGRMELKAEPETFELMRAMVERGDLDALAAERVQEELNKLLEKSAKPSIGFEAAVELGIIEKYYPELHALRGTPQEAEWHPEGDAWVHTMMVVDAAAKIIRQPEREFSKSEKLQVMIGALCHDLGKPSTTELIDGKIRSRGHEEAGRKPTEEMLGRLKYGKDDIIRGASMIAAEHLKPGLFYLSTLKAEGAAGYLNPRQYANAVRKLIARIHPSSWKVLVAASEADSRGRTIPGVDVDPYKPGILFKETVEQGQLDVEPTKPLVAGADIITIASELGKNIKPGKIFGDFIRQVEAARDAGAIKTREEGLAVLRDLISSTV